MSARSKNGDSCLVAKLTRLRLFSGMDGTVADEIVGKVGGEMRRFAKGETVVYEGTKVKWVVPVLRGRLSVYESGANGERHLARVVEPGQLFGATLVTANLEYYPGMAVASEPSEVVFLDIGRIRNLWCNPRYAKFFENLYTIVSAEVLTCWRKMSILSCRKAEDRFMLYLCWRSSEVGLKDLSLPFATSEACARYLGLTRTALSLAVKRLVARGEIDHPARGRFVLTH